MPVPTRTARGLRLDEQALDLMAAAMGDKAPRGRNGKPNYGILTGDNNRTGKATRLMAGEPPSLETVLIVSQNYADAAGIDLGPAITTMFKVVDENGTPVALPRHTRRRTPQRSAA